MSIEKAIERYLIGIIKSITKNRKKNINNLNIKEQARDLQGSLKIEDFTNLKNFNCSKNQLTQVELINCPNLEKIDCSDNRLTGLKLEKLTNLIELDCGNNQLTNLVIKDCPNLKIIHCSKNKLDKLDLKVFPNLKELYCSENQLTELQLGELNKLASLECQNNQLSELETSGCPNLEKIYCNDNKLVKLNLGELENLLELNCSKNQLTSLDISGCPSLEKFDCSNNLLTALDLDNNVELKELSINNNKFQDQVLIFLAHLTKLENLDLNTNGFVGSLRPLNHMNNLKKLNISFTSIESKFIPKKDYFTYSAGTSSTGGSTTYAFDKSNNNLSSLVCQNNRYTNKNYGDYPNYEYNHQRPTNVAKLTKSSENKEVKELRNELAMEREEAVKALEKTKE
ncbi:6245_t:CDS:2 [Funneliformis geosporum]|nr:6245_t:CDS:2 [Funneliformis geosporum]